MKNTFFRRSRKALGLLICFSLLLSLLTALPAHAVAADTVWDGTHPAADAAYAFSGGKGTEEEPYLISTAMDLTQLAANVASGKTYSGVYFKMTADIDATGIEGWKPIGGNNTENKAANPFSGNFDGNFHVVKNINIKKGWYIGFFGYASNATIRNFGIESGSVYSNNSVVGGLIGSADNCVIDNCFNKASVTCDRSGGTMRVGGLAGITTNNTKLLNCYNAGDVLGKTSSVNNWTGGLVGYMSGGVAFEANNCYNVGKVTAMGNASAGGIAGSMDGNAYAEKCFNLGEVSAENAGTTDVWVGSLVGKVLKVSNAMIDSGSVALGDIKFFGVLHADHLEANYTATVITLTKIPTIQGSSFLTKGASYVEPVGATLRAVQETAAANGKQTVRFVGTVNALSYQSVGFEIAMGDQSVTAYGTKMVYSHIYVKANGEYTELCAASQLGGSHIFTATLTDVSATGTVTFRVTPFAIGQDGVKTTGATYTVTYVNGVFTSAVKAA